MNPLYSLLVFPQNFEDGVLYFNIMVLPRNINLFKNYENLPSFVDADISFKVNIINTLDGLPLTAAITHTPPSDITSRAQNKKMLYEQIIQQLERNDNLKISENPDETKDYGFEEQKNKLASKNVSIRKYLPLSYRNAFNFTSSKTRYALTDDEYECIVKNKEKKYTDVRSDERHISWGKLIAFILRNPALAERAGLIYKASVETENGLLEKGGWLFVNFATGTPFENMPVNTYAARIPALKSNRHLFAPVLFPVNMPSATVFAYDSAVQEAILYSDGFAKIVHANQPVNQDLLQETDTSNPPLKEVGLRLGWDDEQLTIWGNRQLKQKDELTNLDIDAPLGVFGYKIDVRRNDDESWHSQNKIHPVESIVLPDGEEIINRAESLELPVEVHPSSHGNTDAEGFWLPMYYTSWNGKCMVIPDKEAQEIHQLTEDKMLKMEQYADDDSMNKAPKKTFHPYVQDVAHELPLEYGNSYEFRVRYMDISGGGPTVENEAINGGQNPVAKVHFKRHIAPSALKIVNLERFFLNQNESQVSDFSILENILKNENILKIERPLLGYPSVVYTGKYENPVAKILEKIENTPTPENPMDRKEYEIGLHDPDVNSFTIKVEIKSLEMDNVLSENGRESFIELYEKKFSFPDEAYDSLAEIEVIYQDYEQISYGNSLDDLGETQQLILPTSRHLRITITPVLDKNLIRNYAADFVAKGKTIILSSFKPSVTETGILPKENDLSWLKAFYLQPDQLGDDPITKEDKELQIFATENGTSVELLRLADALDLSVKRMTLEGKSGQRVQFGISHKMRHSLAPDSASVMFSSVKELFNHWIVAVDFPLFRDWAWNALDIQSFTIHRKIKFEFENDWQNETEVGSIDVKNIANINMLNNPDRMKSRMIFLDVIDPEELMKDFPREIIAEYSIKIHFKEGYEQTESDRSYPCEIHLPITIIPKQLPKLVSTGVAMTPYSYDEQGYRFSDERQKYIWFEFEEAVADSMDTYYARVLSYSPDPYLCRVDEELITHISKDLPLQLNDEKIRTIIPKMEYDNAGVGAMQEMIKETDETGKKIYLLPLPTGLHPNSDELFGFFSYEIRVGHKKESWSTAQARYGRPLKINGVQHIAPELVCNTYRMSKSTENQKIKYYEISAAHANAVLNGKDITAFPPNTSLWYLLYTQVMQADGKSFRNILIDAGPMYYHPIKTHLKNEHYKKESGEKLGTARISSIEIGDRLEMMGLPRSNNLSAIVVEMFPLKNRWQEITNGINEKIRDLDSHFINEYLNQEQVGNPLTDMLGEYRMYRSSVLTPVSEMCCEDC